MAWSWDATANGSVTGNGAAGPLNISINVGTTVDGRQLYSGIAIEDNGAANDRTAWTYNSVNMSNPTNRRFIQGTGFSNIAIQSYMDDSALPTTGLAHNLSATVAEADDWVMHGGLYHGLTQGAPADSDGAAAAATTITTPTMSSAADGLLVGMASYANANAFAAVAGQTLRLDVTVDTMRGGLYDKLTAGDTTLTWTTSGASGRLAGAACSFNIPATGASGTIGVTLADFAPSMAGTTTIVGSMANTLSVFAPSMAGTTTILGTMASTLSDFVSAIQGTTTILGTIANILSPFVSAIQGTTTILGTIANTLESFISAMSGTVGTGPGARLRPMVGVGE